VELEVVLLAPISEEGALLGNGELLVFTARIAQVGND